MVTTNTDIWVETATVMKTGTWVSPHYVKQYTLNVRSPGKQLVLFSKSPDVSPRGSLEKHQDSRENKTNWFPEGPIFLDFHFNSNIGITAANQNSRLGTYKNTNNLYSFSGFEN